MVHFNKLSQQIENASRKFLADIEGWRKSYFHPLKKLVEDYDTQEPAEWLQSLEEWATSAGIWPSATDPQHRLKRGSSHWQTRAYIWASRLKLDLVHLIHERCTLTKQRLELYQQLGLRYSSVLPSMLDEVQKLNLELHKLEINNPAAYQKSLDLREKIDALINKITDEILTTEKPLDLLISDPSRQEQTNKLLKIRGEIDDNLSSLSLVRRYSDWASQEPYIAEVIKYLDKVDAIMIHTKNQLNKGF